MFLKRLSRRGSGNLDPRPREEEGEWQTVKVSVAQLRQAIVLPPAADLNEWLAVNLVDFFNHILLVYAKIKDKCSVHTCPTLAGNPKIDVPWFGEKKAIKCSAPEFFQKAAEWIQLQLDSDLFPRSPSDPFPPGYLTSIRTIFRQIFRMYQHIYSNHRDTVRELGLDDVAILNTCYIHFWLFITRFSLVDQKEVEIMRKVTQTILHAASGTAVVALSQSPGRSSEDSHADASSETVRNNSMESFVSPKMAIIGSGWGLSVQIHAFRKVGFHVAAIWTHRKEDCEAISNEYQVGLVTSNYEELLGRSDIRLFVISTPPFMHYSMATKALEAFKHVVCEPPMSLSIKDAQVLSKMSHKIPGRQSLLDLQLRFLPTVRKMKELVTANYCGKIFTVNIRMSDSSHLGEHKMSWKFQSPAGGGVLYSLGTHCLDLAAWILSSKITSVLGNLMTVVLEKEDQTGELKEVTAEDTATFQAELGHGVHASIFVSTVSTTPPCHRIEIIGTDGWLEINDDVLSGGKTDTPGQRKIHVLNDQQEAPLDKPLGLGTYLFAKALYEFFTDAPFELRDKNIIETSAAKFEEGLTLQVVCEAVRTSSRERGWVDVVV